MCRIKTRWYYVFSWEHFISGVQIISSRTYKNITKAIFSYILSGTCIYFFWSGYQTAFSQVAWDINSMHLFFWTGYQTAFSQLAFASKKDHDPFSDVIDAKEFLAKQIYKLSTKHPGKVMFYLLCKSYLVSTYFNDDDV